MNIITGITKSKFQVPVTELVFRIFILSAISLIFWACASRQPTQEDQIAVKSDVKISSPIVTDATRFVSYQGVTRYMQTNDIRSQMNGIITNINCSIAGNIFTNQSLFTIQPQEAAALQKSNFSSELLAGLSDTVFSYLNGQVENLNVQVGDFVQSGDVLASCIRTNSMRIIAYIPVEQVSALEKMKKCLVILPDGSSVEGQVTGKLPVAEAQNQTQAYIIEPKKNIALAENVNLTVQFQAEQFQNAVFVPESAVLGNEEQTLFWVMKLMNDSTCIKVAVEKGLKEDSLVQLIGSGLTVDDLVVSEGAYGLPDSARIQVTNKKF